MKIQAPFGLVTGCHAADKFMVQGTLASMRYYCPELPICLIVDGNFDVSDLQREYDAIILRISDLPSVEMRRLIAGNFRAKMAAMWEGPFEHYLWLDSDAIIWGNLIPQICRDVDFQIFWNEISISAESQEVPDWLGHYYFSVEALKKYNPEFRWQGRAYFSSGAFTCRRNVISFEEWKIAESWLAETPGLFAWGEMGMLNYMIHNKNQHGEISVAVSDLQHIPEYQNRNEFEMDCWLANHDFPKTIKRPRVAHFCGRKPYLFDRKAYSHPFTIARLAHYRKNHTRLSSWIRIIKEDLLVLGGMAKKRFMSSAI